MNTEVETVNELPPDSNNEESLDVSKVVNTQKRKKFISYTLFVFAFFLVFTGIQALIFYSKYLPQIEDTNGKLFSLTLEKTRGEQLNIIQAKFQSLRTVVKGQSEISSRIEAVFEIMGEHFSGGPLGTIEQVQSELQLTQQLIQEKLHKDHEESYMNCHLTHHQQIQLLKRIEDFYRLH